MSRQARIAQAPVPGLSLPDVKLEGCRYLGMTLDALLIKLNQLSGALRQSTACMLSGYFEFADLITGAHVIPLGSRFFSLSAVLLNVRIHRNCNTRDIFRSFERSASSRMSHSIFIDEQQSRLESVQAARRSSNPVIPCDFGLLDGGRFAFWFRHFSMPRLSPMGVGCHGCFPGTSLMIKPSDDVRQPIQPAAITAPTRDRCSSHSPGPTLK